MNLVDTIFFSSYPNMFKQSKLLTIIYLILIALLGYFLLNSILSITNILEGLDSISGNTNASTADQNKPISTNIMMNTNILLRDSTKPQSDPNPNGYFQIYSNLDPSASYFTMNDASLVTLTMDTLKTTIVTIAPAPNPAGPSDDIHKADMFPIKFNLKLTLDKSSTVFKYEKDGLNDNSTTNTISKGKDKAIEVIRMGKIYDDKFNNIGMANKDLDNPFVFKLNITDSTGISKINIHFNKN